jgi:phenylalanyl-tRNA synthetase alpha chain
VDASTTAEELGDRVREALGDDARLIEHLEVTGETAYADLPPQAIARMGMAPHQKNALLRVVLRDLERTLTHEQANELRDRIYAALHEGARGEWAAR